MQGIYPWGPGVKTRCMVMLVMHTALHCCILLGTKLLLLLLLKHRIGPNICQWNFTRNSNILIHENAFENVVWKIAAFCLGINVLRSLIVAKEESPFSMGLFNLMQVHYFYLWISLMEVEIWINRVHDPSQKCVINIKDLYDTCPYLFTEINFSAKT